MEIHQLQYVVELAKQRNFTRAADEICVTQSTLSHQIAKLEDELDIKLFDRNSRIVFPTEAGEEFIHHAREVLATLEVARQSVLAYRKLLKGTLRIGVIASLGSIDYANMLAKFHQEHQGLNFEIVQEGTYSLLEKIRARELDVAFVAVGPQEEDEDIAFYHLAYDDYVLAVPPGHVFAERDSIDLVEAAEEKFIFQPTSDRMHYTCMEACAQAGFKPQIVCQSNHAPTCLALISAGMGIGFFPREKISGQKLAVTIVKLKQPVQKNIVLAVGRNFSLSPAVVTFNRFVMNWVQGLGSGEE
ncbi:LysR family transcriptional regulator [Anaerospora hongkongensis]|uniref:LysR family transcriptional regulator n=1 Tax=Anaerospora hongkongensis TaxID=244830 RepID=UPI00289AA79D|nr:LysR family transcriptional regulator [Anaerospora hongkongensis]